MYSGGLCITEMIPNFDLILSSEAEHEHTMRVIYVQVFPCAVLRLASVPSTVDTRSTSSINGLHMFVRADVLFWFVIGRYPDRWLKLGSWGARSHPINAQSKSNERTNCLPL